MGTHFLEPQTSTLRTIKVMIFREWHCEFFVKKKPLTIFEKVTIVRWTMVCSINTEQNLVQGTLLAQSWACLHCVRVPQKIDGSATLRGPCPLSGMFLQDKSRHQPPKCRATQLILGES